MIWKLLINLGIAAVALSPALLAVRSLVKRREDARVSWWRLAGPVVLGACVGFGAGMVLYTSRHSDCGDPTWGCLGLLATLVVFGIPLALIGGSLILWAARTPRPWLVGPAGLLTGWAMTFAYSAATLADPGVIGYTVSYLLGYVFAALAIGPFLAARLRLAVYGGVLVLVAGASFVHVPLREARIRADIARLTVPLLRPEVPGYKLAEPIADLDRNTLYLRLVPQDRTTDEGIDRQLTVEIVPLPMDFDPPANCLPGPRQRWFPCEERVGADLWRGGTPQHPNYVLRWGNGLVLVFAGSGVDPATALTAATTLHPTTAAELVP